MTDPLEAISPLDGRYADAMEPLRPYLSEAALFRARVRIEVEYLNALADIDQLDCPIDDGIRSTLRELYRAFDLDAAREIKRIEREGSDERPPTNHDVKAVEYWMADRLAELGAEAVRPWIHFGLTSEDVNNLAYRLLIRDACREVLIPAIEKIERELAEGARRHRSMAMPARTHGQPASPTTYGKELGVFADRCARSRTRLEDALDSLTGKLGGATGTFAAHTVTAPEVDWQMVASTFVEGLDLTYAPLTTQVNPNDDLAAVFDALAGVATVCLDLDRDMWRYISDGYLVQATEAGEVGSSTMPHKVNPIDFENSEGNLAKARSDLRFLADYLPISRLQRDLSDSTIHRTTGTALGHVLLGLSKTAHGLGQIEPDSTRMRADLEGSPAVLAEAMQTALRRIGDPDAYERIKELTRGQTVKPAEFEPVIDDIRAVDPALADRLESLEPATYIGLAASLVDTLGTE